MNKRITIAIIFILFFTACGRKMKDVDKFTYNVTVINNQKWMTENLRVTHFRNGDPIVEAKSAEDWIEYGTNGIPAWCYFDNLTEKEKHNGKLYNWYAINDSRGLAPSGWEIPSFGDWMYLLEDFGGFSSSVQWDQEFNIEEFNSKIDLLKEMGLLKKSCTRFHVSDIKYKDGTKKTGLNGTESGFRNHIGEYKYADEIGVWWTKTEINNYPIIILKDERKFDLNIRQANKRNGFFVRCFKTID